MKKAIDTNALSQNWKTEKLSSSKQRKKILEGESRPPIAFYYYISLLHHLS